MIFDRRRFRLFLAARAPLHTAVLVLPLLLGACAVGPDYRGAPAIDTGSGWTTATVDPGDSAGVEPALAQWWTTFGDPVLDRLVEAALKQNLDLRQAAARIAEVRALRDRAAGGYAPRIDAEVSVTRRRQSENGPLPIGVIPGIERDQTIREIGFDAAWEADLFGRTRRAVEAASARLEAAEAEADGLRTSVAAEVARTYLTLRGAQHELAVRQASLGILDQTLRLTQARIDAGDAPAGAIDSVQARRETVAASLPLIEARLRAASLGLGLLLGQLPESELALIDSPPPALSLLPMPVGERADLLRRRPDVRAAERRLAAASADIGVATAELFPHLGIGASGGFQSLETGNLFDAGSQTFALVPMLSWRIFDGGRVRAEIHASEARQQQAALAYESSVLAALGDAERALGTYYLDLDALRLQVTAVASSRRSHERAGLRYRAGDITLAELLAEEANLRDAEDAHARLQTAAAIDLVALFKALGGGWSPSRQSAAEQASAQR
ncbi:efflux transporter outer membrane subunit [Dokdonella immobilis]|uniref:Efflux transporter, outer membrane factor (OMF) lipoprotein, NodT family n=1 Tax=Dokdonella immobilis TaxID=578942 RepID=A0A1I5B4A6_9GAMM|nr:efflux transporter outer membrane subunit [Dokdonella immobilis]SFN69451.1 efflux transporter, outer membrane factor (OMF) lipoprotein, NodT family [Dokdonella immobilis]